MGRKAKRQKKKEEKAWKPLAFLDKKNNWFIVLLIGVSVLQSKVTIDPNIAIRFVGLSVFLTAYILYFFVLKKNTFLRPLPSLAKWVFISLIGYLLWSSSGIFIGTNPAEAIYFLTKNALEILLMYLAFHAASESEFNWERLVKAMVWLGLFHCVIGLDQQFGQDVSGFRGTADPYGLMVNRNLFGSFLMILLPFSLGYLIMKKSWNFLALVTGVLLLIMTYYSQTRSAWVATAIILGFFGLSYFFKSVSAKKYYTALILFATISVGALLAYNHFVLQAKNRKANAKAEQTGESNFRKKQSANERMVLWKETMQMVQEQPVWGVGLGNWKIEIPRYNQGGTRIEYGEIIRIRPHNIYLHILSETGIIGFLLFYGPWLVIGVTILRLIPRTSDLKRRMLMLVFLSVVIGIGSDGMFSFPTERISHSTFLFVSLGFLLALCGEQKDPIAGKSISWMAFPTLLLAGWGLFLGKEKYNFEDHMNKARVFYIRDRDEQALEHVKGGTTQWVTLEINNDPIELVGALTLKKMKRFDEALDYTDASLVYNPYSSRILNTKGAILTDMKRHEEAIDNYQLALVYSPKHELSIKNVALNYYFLGEYRKCLQQLREINIKDDETFMKVKKAARAKLKSEKKASDKQRPSK